MILQVLRALLRVLAEFASLMVALAQFALLTISKRRRLTLPERARWMQTWCQWTLRLLNIHVEQRGDVPRRGLVVANHLSYLDILVFGAMAPVIFISKIEVRSWLLFGLIARLNGSVFLDRWNLRRLHATLAEAEGVLQSGMLLVAFPEATTTDGSQLLPFRPAMFEAALRSGAPVTAAHVSYTLEDGTFPRTICWVDDVKPLHNLAFMFSRRRMHAHLRIGSTSDHIASSKQAARAAHAEVLAMQREFAPMAKVARQDVTKSAEVNTTPVSAD